MSKKPKYKVEENMYGERLDIVAANNIIICRAGSEKSARKIARALNAMENNPKPLKSKRFVFDWSGIDPKYKWAAMDRCGQWIAYDCSPEVGTVTMWCCKTHRNFNENPFVRIDRPPYPGDWRDSLQKRP